MQEIMEFHNKDHRVLLGYEINYREIDFETYKAKNLTKFAGMYLLMHIFFVQKQHGFI